MVITDRIAILNHPVSPNASEWSEEAARRLVELGFTTVQLNIAWGSRPGGEVLNLEDVLPFDESIQRLKLYGDRSKRGTWLAELQRRLAIARAVGLRTIFHFGAPNNEHGAHGDSPPNCLRDPIVRSFYVELVQRLWEELPVDDLWLYTYDQDAWLCSEFGTCPNCSGIPLHERLAPFLDDLAGAWRSVQPTGRTWWEPWELSAGQILNVVERVEVEGFGLALHNNAAEAMVTMPGDRNTRNIARAAAARGIPVTIEGFFGAATEEVEPFESLQSPLTTYRQVVEMSSIPGATGLKEYFGLDLSKEDPNLRAASLAFGDPSLSEESVLEALSDGYGSPTTRGSIERVWRLASEAMDLYPWDASWFVRKVGRAEVEHSTRGAEIRGFTAHTPAWRSTRAATFMAVTDAVADPWLLEDLQLRWAACAAKQAEAIEIAESVMTEIDPRFSAEFQRFLTDLREFRRRVLAYEYHSRETNLTAVIRDHLRRQVEVPERVTAELRAVLDADELNAGTPYLREVKLLHDSDPQRFVETYFVQVPPEPIHPELSRLVGLASGRSTELTFPFPF